MFIRVSVRHYAAGVFVAGAPERCGQGGAIGTILGVIIGLIGNGLNLLRMDSFRQYACKGIVIPIAVYTGDIKDRRLPKRVGRN